MTIQLASAIVSQFGPCRIVAEAPGIPTLPAELALLGCEVSGTAAYVIVLEALQPGELKERIAPYTGANGIALIANGMNMSVLEAALFDAGWQRLPGALDPNVLALLARGDVPGLYFYERAPDSYAGILNSRDAGALAAIGRWVMASGKIRPGDHVLLWGPGANEGRTIVEALSRTRAVEAVEKGADLPDRRRFDAVVAFDAPEGWLDTIHRCTHHLKQDGRLVLGWSGSRHDAPPSWETLEEALSDELLIEGRFAQASDHVAPQPVPIAAPAFPGWQIAVAVMNPIGGEADRESYVHPAFGGSKATLVDFASGYDNPWLYRVMVQMGERLTDDLKLARLAEYIVLNSRAGSADRGAALAVLGYRVLENRADNVAPALLDAIAAYHDQAGEEPHVTRWRVSLAFLAGRLNELIGDRAAAKQWYTRASSDDWRHFSSILATKAVGAAFFVGRLFLAERAPEDAWPWFKRGVDIALEAAGSDHHRELGTGEGLLPFYLPELAEVIDMGSQCANALANRHLWARNPGLFWRQVDVKRFGLASWAIDVARENAQLRQMAGSV